jgi:DNA-binding response OmpR family regulator
MAKDDLDGCAILLVEDDLVIAGDVAAIVEQAGGRVIGPADSLGEGFQLLESGGVDCALLDINLNSLLVFGLADALAERHVPIVFLSAEQPAEVPAQHRQRPFVRKPFSRPDVLAAIHAAIGAGGKTAASKPSDGYVKEPVDGSPMAAA